MAKKKVKKEKSEKDEDLSEPEVKQDGLSFLETALKKSKDSKKALEEFMGGKAESKTEETANEKNDNIEITPQLTSETSQDNKTISEGSGIKIEVLEDFKEIEDLPTTPHREELNLYENMNLFFTELFNSFSDRYTRWENSTGMILSILRKMRKITKKNTEQLINSIENLLAKTQKGLTDFEIKRNEIEKISNTNFGVISKDFKKILGLLELQIQEYQLKKEVSELLLKPS